jgi:CNT family concentrative nucleoside transporter
MAAAVHLTYDKSVLMATYMLCGFANFASIGIQIGGIGTIAPSQKKTLSELGFKSTYRRLTCVPIVGNYCRNDSRLKI